MRYERQMLALIGEMSASIEYWLQAQYRDTPPALAAMDATPSKVMLARFRALAKKWQKHFEQQAPKIADAYLKGSFKATDSAMRMALKDTGIAVKFKMTPAMRDAFNATLEENVGLIKSIPQRYLSQVEGIVTRSYASGRDLETMVKEIRALYPKAQNSAVLIARDQSNKANSVVENARRLEIGITQALWLHSGGGKHPRASHVRAAGQIYNIRKGCPIRNEKGQIEYIQPGQKINCRCVSRSVIPGLPA
jgi:uncharacterized protein with gpF-like domain